MMSVLTKALSHGHAGVAQHGRFILQVLLSTGDEVRGIYIKHHASEGGLGVLMLDCGENEFSFIDTHHIIEIKVSWEGKP